MFHFKWCCFSHTHNSTLEAKTKQLDWVRKKERERETLTHWGGKFLALYCAHKKAQRCCCCSFCLLLSGCLSLWRRNKGDNNNNNNNIESSCLKFNARARAGYAFAQKKSARWLWAKTTRAFNDLPTDNNRQQQQQLRVCVLLLVESCCKLESRHRHKDESWECVKSLKFLWPAEWKETRTV